MRKQLREWGCGHVLPRRPCFAWSRVFAAGSDHADLDVIRSPVPSCRFVTQAHVQDENFIRIGKHLERAKVAKGVTKL